MKKKFALIGLDSAIPSLVSKYFEQGRLGNMKQLAKTGVWSEIMPVFPSHTAANWNTIATGAWPNTHGVTDMVVHMPGKPLTEIVSGFYSHLCQAEQIWKTAERNGKKSILMKYIGSWPPNMKNGLIQVEGFGAPGGPGSRPWGSSPLALSNSSCFCTEQLQNATVVKFSKSIVVTSPSSSSRQARTTNVNSHGTMPSDLTPIQTKIEIGPPDGKIGYTVTLFSSSTNSPKVYDAALIARQGNDDSSSSGGNDGRLILKKGEISDWLIEDFRQNGKIVKASFRMRLVDIGASTGSTAAYDHQHDSKGEQTIREGQRSGLREKEEETVKFKLFVSQIFPLEGWTYPDNIAQELTNRFGPFLESISHFPFAFGWTDENTFLDDLDYQAKWMANATQYLMTKNDWDLYMTQWHGIDNTQHAFLRFDKSVLSEYERELSERVVLRSYEIADDFVGHIFNAARGNKPNNNYTRRTQNGPEDKDHNSEDDEVYTFVISDHGHVMGKRRFFINQYLYEQGLIKLRRDQFTNKVTVDWAHTQAFSQGMVSVYVNLKGREPDGCVEPGKGYEDLVDRLIDLLYDIKDPLTGQRPMRLALSNRDSEFLGLSGERTGDVVFAVNPVYVPDNRMRFSGDLFENLKTGLPDGSIHGQQLPSVDLGKYGTIRSMLIANGPGIKKGYVTKRPLKMVDIAPTIAYILGIPAPKNSEGTVIRDLFE